jgi:hypothetical protein
MEKPLGKSGQNTDEVDHFSLLKVILEIDRINLKIYFIGHILG